MTHTVLTIANIASIAAGLAVEDVIVHKPLEYATVVYELQKVHPEIKLMYAHPGTDTYTEHGYNTSVVIGGLST